MQKWRKLFYWQKEKEEPFLNSVPFQFSEVGKLKQSLQSQRKKEKVNWNKKERFKLGESLNQYGERIM